VLPTSPMDANTVLPVRLNFFPISVPFSFLLDRAAGGRTHTAMRWVTAMYSAMVFLRRYRRPRGGTCLHYGGARFSLFVPYLRFTKGRGRGPGELTSTPTSKTSDLREVDLSTLPPRPSRYTRGLERSYLGDILSKVLS
jgi:hypothetical protein